MGKNNKKKENERKNKQTGSSSLADQFLKIGLVNEEKVEAINKPKIGDHIKSPYNFVAFDKRMGKLAAYCDDLPNHNGLNDPVFKNGYIELSIENTTPLIVAQESGNSRTPMTNEKGKYIIPGSTIRGLIRQNCQILSLSKVDQDLDGEKYLTYREIASNDALGKAYKKILDVKVENKVSVSKNVKAGYLVHDANGYHIIPAKEIEGKSFFPVHEGDLRAVLKDHTQVNFMYKGMKSRESFSNRKIFLDYYKKAVLNRSSLNTSFKPYFALNVNFKMINQMPQEIKLGMGKGALLCSEYMYKKKRHVLINPADENETTIHIPENEIASYENYLKVNKIKDQYYFLPEKNEKKPCFYVFHEGRIYFGFTQYIRLFYRYPIKHGLPKKISKEGYDYVESIFGFIHSSQETSYKSRVSFCDLQSDNAKLSPTQVSTVLGAPKPTFYKYYIREGKNYNDPQFDLGGFKQYWLKQKTDSLQSNEKNDKVNTTFYPLQVGAEFKGRIYFNQLTEEEIGLLLWALKVDEFAEYNIGLAKAFGYGAFKVTQLKLAIDDLEKKYASCAIRDYTQNYSGEQINKFIDLYKKHFKTELGKSVDEITSIKEFIQIKTNKVSPNESSKFRFLSLEDHKKTESLPSISNYVGKYTIKIKD